MRDDRLRDVVRRGLAPLFEDVGDGPAWEDLNTDVRRSPRGLLLAMAAAATVVVIIGSVALLPGGTGPDIAGTTTSTLPGGDPPSLEGYRWQEARTSLPDSPGHRVFDLGDRLLVIHEQNRGTEVVGEIYDPVANQAIPITADGLVWRANASMVWTGSELLMVGGSNGPGLNRIAVAYDPDSDSWRDLPDPPVPVDAWENSIGGDAVWTGAEMIIPSHGLAFDPIADTWRSLPSTPGPVRSSALTVWTGSEVVVWGGCDTGLPRCDETGEGALADGHAFDPVTGRWRTVASNPALAVGVRSSGAWTGSELLVYTSSTTGEAAFEAYDPSTDEWEELPMPPVPPRLGAATAWSGEFFTLWGGTRDGAPLVDGAVFDPRTRLWSELPPPPDGSEILTPIATWVRNALYVVGVDGGPMLLTDVEPVLGACTSGPPLIGIDLRFEDLIRYYNASAADQMVSVIGDGPVFDPSLEPEGDGRYESVAEWLAAVERVGDTLSSSGYGMGEPFSLFVTRSNPGLEADGIDHLSLTLRIWANQDCELRVESADVASAPDPCRYYVVYAETDLPETCLGPYDQRYGHLAVWTGGEVLIVGGRTGTGDGAAQPPSIALDPSGSTRQLADPPGEFEWWPTKHAFWTGEQLLVVGRIGTGPTVGVFAYDPVSDAWSVGAPHPEGTYLGGVVWTGADLVFVGGVHNGPSDEAWAYSHPLDTWRKLPDPGIPPVEGMEGVRTPTPNEAVFVGGYAGAGTSPGVAWNPATQTWRELSAHSRGSIESHEVVWTGEVVIAYSGNTGPQHRDRVLMYDPVADSWSESSPMPIEPAERLQGVWTGSELILWGGFATYGDAHTSDEGAAYDPATDTWRILAPSPLSARCDHTATWTGEEVIVFGGIEVCGDPNKLATGTAAAYDPVADRWRVLDE